MTGVGGRGPRVGHDVVVTAQFLTANQTPSNVFSVACGIVPDGTFPADLVLGKSVFHKWGLLCEQKNGKEVVNLVNFPGTPFLAPDDAFKAFPVDETTVFSAGETPLSVQWSKDTPIDNPLVRSYLKEYEERFPGLFDPAKRRTDAIRKLSSVRHRIDTGDATPYRQTPRRYSPAQEQAIRDFVKAHDGTLIQRSKSPWASASHLVPKKHPGQTTKPDKNDPQVIWRFCCDYRELNKRTKKHAHPLPNTMDQIQRAAGHSYYAFIDLKDGFWHVLIHENDREKSAFLTPNGLYEWIVMPFGLTNAPATFQALVEEILEPYRDFVSGLLDDMAVWADTLEQLHERLLLLLARLEEYGMLLNTRKTALFVTTGTFLGFVVDKDGIHADPAKVAAIRDRPMPATTTEIRGFVNAAGYFRSLIPEYAKESGALTDQSVGPKGAPVTLSSQAQKQWKKIRDLITTIPLVKPFDWQLPCVVESDASDGFIGAAFLQPHMSTSDSTKRVLHPVAYYSRKLSPTQRRYSAQERELLGLLLALQHWKHWVQGTEVTVVTDHESLKGLGTKTDHPPRIMRFLDAIEHYGVRIVYRPGKANVLADYLSRPPSDEAVEPAYPVQDEEEEGALDSSMEQIQHPHQLNRLDLQAIYEFLTHDSPLPRAIDPAWTMKHFVVDNNRLTKKVRYTRLPGDPPHPEGLAANSTVLLEVPDVEAIEKLATRVHEEFGHATVGSTVRQLTHRFWHPELTLAAQKAVLECRSCQLMKKPDATLPDLTPIPPPPPLTRWAIDFTTVDSVPLLVAVEYATGWVEAELTANQTFSATVPLLQRIHDTFGTPREWVSDNAGCFNGEEAKAWHRRHGSHVFPVTPSRPRGNGKVERVNGALKHTIVREWLAHPQREMGVSVRRAVALYNRTPKPSGYSPFFLLFGTTPPTQRDASSTASVAAYVRDPTDQEESAFDKELVQHHEAPIARLRANGLAASRDRTRAYLQEKKALLRTYAPGDWVLRVRQRGHKHEPYYDGPWAVMSCHSGNTYKLRSPGGIVLTSKYNGTNLFPAYVADGHPVRSLWYASKTTLAKDREGIAINARLGKQF